MTVNASLHSDGKNNVLYIAFELNFEIVKFFHI